MKRFIFIFLGLILSFFRVQAQTDLQKATVRVASSVGKSVVSISTVAKWRAAGPHFYFDSPFGGFEDSPFRRFFEEFFGEFPEREYKRIGLGSGVIIDKEGYILTNEHVISGATQIKVKLSDGREYDAEIKGTDPHSDLAVIKIDAHNLPVAVLGDSDQLEIGEWVVAIGNPFGFAIENPEPTVTVGVISALHRYVPALGRRERSYDDLIQTDAAINPGNSGGPLVNLGGEVIGINTAIITTTGGYQGLGFAIPINKAKTILNKLIRGEKVLYGWLGVRVQDLNEDLRDYFGLKEKQGVVIVKIEEGSPAEEAGLKEGDLILSFNNQGINTTRDLIRMVSFSEVGKLYSLGILREGKEILIKIKIGARPQDLDTLSQNPVWDSQSRSANFRGMIVEDISSSLKARFRLSESEGVIITSIEEGSPAERSGLNVGDIILKIEGKPIKDRDDFLKAVSQVKGICLVKTNRGLFVLREK